MSEPASRRRRMRAETEAAIKTLAWDAMRESGAAALSLRDVARQMGMAPSALYRYFPSRTELLTALTIDAFDSLGDDVAAEYARGRASGAAALDVFLGVAHTYRRWALTHRAEWGLIFSTSLPDYQGKAEPSTAVSVAAQRSFGVLQRLTADAVDAGVIDVDRLDRTMTPELRDNLRAWAHMSEQDVPPSAVAGSLWAYAVMHGVISLDMNGRLPPPLLGDEAFFDSAMRAMLAQIAPAGHAPR